MRLENYRCFSDLNINFDERLTVLVGVNGAGKTAVLDGVAFFLETCSYTKTDFAFSYGLLPLSDRKINSDSLSLTYKLRETESDEFDIPIRFELNNWQKLHFSPEAKQKFDNFMTSFLNKSRVEDDAGLPIFAYYTSKRILNDLKNSEEASQYFRAIPLRHAAYDNAFKPQIDFSTTLQWFVSKASEEGLAVQRLKDLTYTIPELLAVRKAVATALGDYDEPYVDETPPKLFITHKDHPDQPLQIEQLSDGYRTMLALVMDLARRMAQANEKFNWPEGQGVLHSPAVVLIDEVELHLHPSWQQRVLPSLMEIFPNAQFIVSTHSPQILTSIAAKHIRVLKDGKIFSMNEETEGAEASRVLEDVFDVNSRPPENEFVQKLQDYSRLIQGGKWDEEETKKLRAELDKHYRGSEPSLQKLDLYIKTEKWKRAL